MYLAEEYEIYWARNAYQGARINNFQIIKINVRVRLMMGDKCMRDKASNVMDCVMDMTEVEEENIDMEVPDNISEVGPSSDVTSRVGVGSPYPVLTVEKVLETYKRISAIKTPEID